MSSLQKGWTSSPVKDLFTMFAGGTPSKANPAYWNGPIPWLSSGDIKSEVIDRGSRSISPKALQDSSAKVCRTGSVVVVVRSGILKHTLPVAVLSGEVAINQDIKCLDSGHDDLNRWLATALRANARSLLSLNREGTTVQSVKSETLEGFELPIPPLGEQRRIAAKLDVVLARVRTSQQRLEKVPKLLRRFRQAVLDAAFSGKLTADWRELHGHPQAHALLQTLRAAHEAAGGHKRGNAAPPTEDAHNLNTSLLPDTWAHTEMREVVRPNRPITYGILKPGPDLAGGILYVRVADFPGDRLALSTIRRTSPEIERAFARARLDEGDILLSIRGTVGRVVVVPPALIGANITQDTARLTIQSTMCRDYVTWYLRAPATQRRMQNAVKGVAVRGINIGDVRALQVPIPPFEEQAEIVHRIEQFFTFADRLDSRLNKATEQVGALTQSILMKAFRGELVPTEAELAAIDGSIFESGEHLLEHIKEQKDASINRKPKGRPKNRLYSGPCDADELRSCRDNS